MKKYTAVLFDLCGTVLQYRIDRLPSIEINGQTVQTTTPLLYACFLEFDRGKISFEQFHEVFIRTTEEMTIEKRRTGNEVLSSTRFESFLKNLNADLGKRGSEIKRLLMEIHFERVKKCLELLPQHRELLCDLKKRYHIGLVTNFDHAATVHEMLARDQISDFFEIIVISAEIGIRKPRPEIFTAALKGLHCDASETLFVGDNWDEDITGAKKLGMHTAWINAGQISPPEAVLKPDEHFSDLSELSNIL